MSTQIAVGAIKGNEGAFGAHGWPADIGRLSPADYVLEEGHLLTRNGEPAAPLISLRASRNSHGRTPCTKRLQYSTGRLLLEPKRHAGQCCSFRFRYIVSVRLQVDTVR